MARSVEDLRVLIRGAGEMASGIALRLRQCHMLVVMTEVAMPTAVRRTVAFAEAIYEGVQDLEGVRAFKVCTSSDVEDAWSNGVIPLLVDPGAEIKDAIRPDVVVDAIMAKKATDTCIADAPLVVGVGPGFTAGENVHAVVESNRGYDLGKVIWQGSAEPYTGVPATVAGHAQARVFRTPAAGRFKALRQIGDVVEKGETVAHVNGVSIDAQIDGLIRGMLRDGIDVSAGVKAGDIDPRRERGYCYSVSDKARAIGGGVLEAILHFFYDPRALHS
ncbi:MAG TPA: selenium-dependent molybdenum cofactor biosynthesis protein YqeB [Candidatus Binatia bacterium]|jgi:xanthine dehydrogenase accessory factor